MQTHKIRMPREAVLRYREGQEPTPSHRIPEWRKRFAEVDWLLGYQCNDLAYDLLGIGGGDGVGVIDGLTGVAPQTTLNNPGRTSKEAWGGQSHRIETAGHALVLGRLLFGMSFELCEVLDPYVARLQKRPVLSAAELAVLWFDRESILSLPAHFVWLDDGAAFDESAEFTRLRDGRISIAFRQLSKGHGVEVILPSTRKLTPTRKGELIRAGLVYSDLPRLADWLVSEVSE